MKHAKMTIANTKIAKKLLSTFMSIVLLVGLTPLPAWAETDGALQTGQIDLQGSANAVGESAENASHESTLESAGTSFENEPVKTYNGKGFTLEYVSCTYALPADPEHPENPSPSISGVQITKIMAGASTDIVIPRQITNDDVTYDVIGIDLTLPGYGDHSQPWTYRGAASITIPDSVHFVRGIGFAELDGYVKFTGNSPITELDAGFFDGFRGPVIQLPTKLTKISATMLHRAQITSIELPGTVKQIDQQAFYGANKLASVKLNEGLLTIGVEAFASEPGGGSYYYGNNLPLTEIEIPSTVYQIQEKAFAKVMGLKKLTFAGNSSLTTIGDYAFYGTSLESVSIPDGVTSIGIGAFAGWNGPANIGDENPGQGGTHTLTSVSFGSSQADSNLTTLGSIAFSKQPITSITLPNKLTSFGYDSLALSDNGRLDISGTRGAFSGCADLKSIAWPNSSSFTTVGGFDYCTSLTAATIESLPASVTRIDNCAFYDCPGIDDVIIPRTVTSIGMGAFSQDEYDRFYNRTFTLANKDVEIEGWTAGDPTKGPWRLERGYTIRYPRSAAADSSIVKYRQAVEAYEAARNISESNRTKFETTADDFFRVTGTVPEGATVSLVAGAKARQPELNSVNSFTAWVEGGEYVNAVVSLEGYADYQTSPDPETDPAKKASIYRIDRDWSFTVTADQMPLLSTLGTLQVSATGAYRANCNVAVFTSAGKLVSQGAALRVTQSDAEVAPAYVVKDIPAGDYIVVAWQENEHFSRISSINDIESMGFSASDYATGTATIIAGKTAEVTLDIPRLDTSKIATVLAAGDVVITSKNVLRGVPFNATVSYETTTGQAVDSVMVSIPEGLSPSAVATTSKDYGISGWNSTTRVLTISGLADDDLRMGKISIALVADEPGNYAISASLKSGDITVPLGGTSVECKAIQLVAPQGTLSSREFTVHVYAKPLSDVTLKIGGTVLSKAEGTMDVEACETNSVGHAKVKVKIPDSELSASQYYQVTATLSGEETSDSAVVEYLSYLDAPLEPTVYDFWFESAGQEFDLAKAGVDLSGGSYTVASSAHPKIFSTTWPFTASIDSLQPLEQEATLYLGMLDNSVRSFTMRLSGTEDLVSGAKRYTYTTMAALDLDGSDGWSAGEIPCRFDVLPGIKWYSTSKQPEYTQADDDAMNAAVSQKAKSLYKNGADTYARFFNGLPDRGKKIITGTFLFDNDTTVTSGGKTWDYTKLQEYGYDFTFGVFNRSFMHETWDKEGIVWDSGTLSNQDKADILAAESQVAAAFDYLAALLGDSKPMYEYASFDAYLAAEHSYTEKASADPKRLAQSGYVVTYDKAGNIEWPGTLTGDVIDSDGKINWPEPVTSTSAWYAVDPSYLQVEGGLQQQGFATESAEGLAVETAIEPDDNSGGSDGPGETSVFANLGGKFEYYAAHWGYTGHADHSNIDTVISSMNDLSLIAGSNLLSQTGGKACATRGTLSALGLLMTVKSGIDNVDNATAIESERTTRVNELKRINDMYHYYVQKGKGDSDCANALMQESMYLDDYLNDLKTESNIAFWTHTVGTLAGGIGNASGMAAEYLAVNTVNAPTPAAKEALTGSAAMCAAVSLTCTAVGTLNTGAGILLSRHYAPEIKAHKAKLKEYRAYREMTCKADKDDAFAQLHYNKKPGIDPSGFTYAGVEDNRIEGVMATIYQKVNGEWVAWNDAITFEQTQTQVTSTGGLFAWDVPIGDWKILFQKEGYVDAWSNEMHVLPEWTNVAINLLATTAQVQSTGTSGNYINITFTQYMKTSKAPTVTIDGKAVTGSWVSPEKGKGNEGYEGTMSKVFRVAVPSGKTPGSTMRVVVSGGESYAGVALTMSTTSVKVPGTPPVTTQTMYRLYNQWSGEHLFTLNKDEYNKLGAIGWKQEGEAWKSPTSGTKVYRLYNQYSGDHHYTTSADEYATLGRIGWTQEGVAFYSGGNRKVYRGFNPYETIGTHHYTTDANEMNAMVRNGWKGEGVGWYCY